ncbi:MAG: hypothetical protein HOJ34_11390 [Kordiimonadaceae bacterium]|nr:hypothetical protein [Kordiimonadaceae bacterium]MBT6036396.1 hypothetical protein [Kordiimonadaceae bacterium]MBT6330376.1 hypothetical protein [Kordiimonadaceae bacterium]MBT7582233.1 hypothetical protein [Kordiimonadaceae bacterium]
MKLFARQKKESVIEAPVVLDLSGENLKFAFERLLGACDEQGGIERFSYALQVRRDAFKSSFNFKSPTIPGTATFQALCAYMPTVRRRIAPYIEHSEKNKILKQALLILQDGAENVVDADERINKFCSAFPKDKEHRWVWDLACEILHGTDPERYPLMCRWIWDTSTNTGVLREIWFSENLDHVIIDVSNNFETFIALRQELSKYLSENGVYRDMLQVVDLLQAQIYAGYICEHGSTYIRADFTNPEDPMMHIRRLLGLDGVSSKGRSRLKTIEGQSVQFDTNNFLS